MAGRAVPPPIPYHRTPTKAQKSGKKALHSLGKNGAKLPHLITKTRLWHPLVQRVRVRGKKPRMENLPILDPLGEIAA